MKLLVNRGAEQMNEFIRNTVEKDVLLPIKLVNKFHGELQQCLSQCQLEAQKRVARGEKSTWELEQLCHIDDRIKLRRHGPAVQMDVMHWPNTSEKFYSVDMVPMIEIPRGNDESEYYVAKPIKKRSIGRRKAKPFSGPQDSWRESFALEEKKCLETADDGNGCRKQVFRVLKVLRHHDGGLSQLSSYHLKTALLTTMHRRRSSEEWTIDCLGQRLMDVMEQLKQDMDNECMHPYYSPDVDLLQGFKDATILNIHNRLKRLTQNENKMMKLLLIIIVHWHSV